MQRVCGLLRRPVGHGLPTLGEFERETLSLRRFCDSGDKIVEHVVVARLAKALALGWNDVGYLVGTGITVEDESGGGNALGHFPFKNCIAFGGGTSRAGHSFFSLESVSPRRSDMAPENQR